jgi:hypothetical protein
MNIDQLKTNTFLKIEKTDNLWNFLEQLSEYAVKQYFEDTKFELQDAFQNKIDGGFDYTLYIKIYTQNYPIIKKFEIFVPNESNPVIEEDKTDFVWNQIDIWKEEGIVKDTPKSPKKVVPVKSKYTNGGFFSFFGGSGAKSNKKVVKKTLRNPKKVNATILYVSPSVKTEMTDFITVIGTNFNVSDSQAYVLFKMVNKGDVILEEKVIVSNYNNSNNFTVKYPSTLSGPLTIKYVSAINESKEYTGLYSQ